ncbi:DNA replication/repair protein RecF [Sulfuriflexus mobilis]|uniref:DNA replication/repair protein RecF n=1 Tax=Sulfuriflexus mobilis TaxID=1811807 RepID=UPI000F83385F|nr:DNA replication/repair protein RecF [Sulfuriflexus mobilis]
MTLERLDIQQLRNIHQTRLLFGEQLNLIVGANASGKTSLLEAIYLLGTGRSFRTNRLQHVIEAETDQFTVSARIRAESGALITAGMALNRQGRILRVDGKNARSSAQLAEILPLQLINQQCFNLIDEGPAHRRKFLDWGVFHVEQGFFVIWQRYMRALKQRNAALKRGNTNTRAWEKEMSEAAVQLHGMREAYVEALKPILHESMLDMLEIEDISVDYRPGWDTGRPLADVLAEEAEQDRGQGFSRYGPQRADLIFRRGTVAAKERLSRGQQKLLVSALILGQARLLAKRQTRRSTVLIDDITAELDARHCARLMKALADTGAQLVVTAIDAESIPKVENMDSRMFHVEHGVLKTMV